MLAGCATYHPKPLEPDAVEKALQVPAAAALTEQAAAFKHPILQPVRLDPASPLSPQTAAILAVLINPSLRAKRDRIQIAGAQVIAAGLLPNPTLSVSPSVVTAGSASFRTPYGIGAAWDISTLITRDARLAAARAGLSEVRLDVAWAEWQAAQAAKAAVYDQIALQRQVKLARAIRRRLRENLGLIQTAYDRHQRTVLQLSAAKTAERQAQARVLSLEQQRDQQTVALRRALGLPVGTPVELRDDISLPARLRLPPQQALLSDLQQQRLDLVALRRGYQSQEETVRAAILDQFPSITLGPSAARDNSGVTTIGFSLSVSLPIFNQNQGPIATERATRQKLYDEYTARVFTAQHDVERLLSDIHSLTEQIAAAKAALSALRSLVATYRTAVDEGAADVLSYYQAWNDLSNKRIDIVRLEQQLVDDWTSLELAVGRELPQ